MSASRSCRKGHAMVRPPRMADFQPRNRPRWVKFSSQPCNIGPAAASVPGEEVFELGRLDGLREVGVESGGQGPPLIFGLAVARERDQARASGLRSLASH